jgi:condensin complex subunit 2
LEDKAISHSLADFAFSKNAFSFDETTFFQDNISQDDDDDDGGGDGVDMAGNSLAMDVDNGAPPVEDFFIGTDAVNDDYGGGNMMGGDDYGGDNHSNGSVGPPGEGDGQSGAFVPFDPRRAPNERDLVMAMTDADDEGMMDYFDQNFLKNWAGPEHWKLRKVVRRRGPSLFYFLR